MAKIHLVAHIVIEEDVAKEFVKNQDKDSCLSFDEPLEYFENEFGWLNESGIFLRDYSKVPEDFDIRNIKT